MRKHYYFRRSDRGLLDLHVQCRLRLREINLHWHDLRHEYASRLVERGVPLAQVRDLLGHASILTTERYDNQRLEHFRPRPRGLKRARRSTPPPKTRTKFQESFRFQLNRAYQAGLTPRARMPQITDKP